MTFVCGIEEAGRGPLLGPMVMCGVVIDEKNQAKLKALGIKDSKLLTPKKREELFDVVKENCISYEIVILPAGQIDAALISPELNLNKLEAITSANIINKLKPEKAILDCPSTNPPAYKEFVKEHVSDKKINIIAEHKADVNYPVVSAASILAKVTRDRLIEDLKVLAKKTVGDGEIGSGYPSDPYSKKFLEKYWDKFDDIKDGFFRKTWSSYKKVEQAKSQKTLF